MSEIKSKPKDLRERSANKGRRVEGRRTRVKGGRELNDGYKSLIAQILLQTYREALYGRYRADGREFIHSTWCQTLCESVNIDYKGYYDKVLAALEGERVTERVIF